MGCLNDPVMCFMTVFCCPCMYGLTRERAGLQAREPAALSVVAAVMAQPILFAFVSRYAGETVAGLYGGFMVIGLPIWMSKLQNLQSTSISLDAQLHLMNATRKSLAIPFPS